MRNKILFLNSLARRVGLVVLLSTLNLQLSTVLAQSTAFTYQGRLIANGTAANGSYDLQFFLRDAAVAGNPVGVTNTIAAVNVNNGLFTVSLDFGGSPFTDPNRWLEIAVRANGGGSYVALAPRQLLTAAPYAISAITAINLAGVVGYNTNTGSSATVGGGYGNTSSGVLATVGGGSLNTSSANQATVGGGSLNTSSGWYATVAGGAGNTSSSTFGASTVGGGFGNTSSGEYATVGGGFRNKNSGPSATIGGGFGNIISNSASYATVPGGFSNTASAVSATVGGGSLNSATNAYATVSGGAGNTAGGQFSFAVGRDNIALGEASTVAGGQGNRAIGIGAFIGGGGFDGSNIFQNVASGGGSVIGGGIVNRAAGLDSTVGGGVQNTASGDYSTVPGGNLNTASGESSFAAGQRANANHAGTFAWGDSQGDSIASTGPNQFLIRAGGGVQLGTNTSLFFGNNTRQMVNLWGTEYGIGVQAATMYFRCDASPGDAFAGFRWYRGGAHNDANGNAGGGTELMSLGSTYLYVNGAFVSSSDRNKKENFAPVQPREVLEKVVALPITRWNYKSDAGTPHIGPMAQDFHAAFGVGPDNKHIATVDADGVALAAIQGLNQKFTEELKQKQTEITELKRELGDLKRLVHSLTQKLSN